MVAFFLAEMGDKTQIATAALAARFETVIPVVIGTTAGMMIADLPAVLCGHAFAHKINPRWVRYAAAAIFAGLGVTVLVESGIAG
jgi:putative Ca2+/H+ antiporter (TMEM165/GDT1 family)